MTEVMPRNPSASDAQARIDHEIPELTPIIDEFHARIYSLHTQINALHAEMESFQTRIHSLRTQRNMLSSVFRLPPEILSVIFIHWARIHYNLTGMVEQDEVGSMSDGTESMEDGTDSVSDELEELAERVEGVPEWVNVSHVCRYWRDVALDCPSLWSYISPASERWIQEMLSRSKTAPLKIRFEWTRFESNALHILKELLAHTERIEELRLDFLYKDAWKVFPMFSSPAPLLQSLEIHVIKAFGHRNDELHSIETFFNGVTPTLRRLELDQCFISQNASVPVLDSLTSLTLSYLEYPIAPTPAELHKLLSFMPHLVHLELNGALSRSSDELVTQTTAGSQNIRLPHLLRFAMDEPFSKAVEFLSCLDIPSQTEVRINTFYVHPEEWMSFRSLFLQRFFDSRCRPLFDIRALAITVGIQDSDATSLVFSTSENCDHPPSSADWDCDIPLKINTYLSDEVDTRDIIRDILQDANLNGLLAGLQNTRIALSVSEDSNECSPFLEDFFGLLPKLRSIKLIDASISLGCLFSFLSLTPHQRDPDTSPAGSPDLMFAPGLEELVLSRCQFDQGMSEPDQHDASVTNLSKSLAIRKEKGLNLTRLTLIQCRRVFGEDVAGLKEVAAEIFWDGVEEKESESEGSSYFQDTSDSEDSSVYE